MGRVQTRDEAVYVWEEWHDVYAKKVKEEEGDEVLLETDASASVHGMKEENIVDDREPA